MIPSFAQGEWTNPVSSARRLVPSCVRANQLRDHDRVVVLRVPRCIEDRDRTIRGAFRQLDQNLAAAELVAIARAELRELRRIVREPPTKVIARGQTARPLVELGALA